MAKDDSPDAALERVGYILTLVSPAFKVTYADGEYTMRAVTRDADAVKSMAEQFLVVNGQTR